MREQLHDDNFEDFLREKINEFDGEPNSQMWDRIEGVIPPAPKPVVFKYLTPVTAAASVLLTCAVLAAVYQYRSNRDLNQQLIEATDKIKTLENQTEKTKTTEDKNTENTISLEEAESITENQSSTNSQNQRSTQQETSDKTNNRNNSTTKNQSKSNNSSTSSDVKKDTPKQSNAIKNNTPSVTDTDNNQDKDKKTTPDADIKNDAPSPLQSNVDNKTSVANQSNDGQLPTSQKEQEEQEKDTEKIFDLKNLLASKAISEVKPKDTFWYLDSVKVEVPKFKDHLVLGAFIQPMRTRAVLRATPGAGSGGGNQPFNQHKAKPVSSWSTGVTIGYQASKNWSVHAGVAYQTSQFDMEFDTRIRYDKTYDGPLSPNGLRIHRRPYLVISPFGNMDINVDLRRNPDVQIPDDISMRVYSTGKHEISNVSLPVYMQAQTVRGALKTGFKFGIAPQIVTNSVFKLETVAAELEGPLNVAFTSRESTLSDQPELHRQVVIDGLLGLIFAYQISLDAELSLEPTLMANMGRKHDTQFGSTQLVSTGLQIGYKYHF